jgi:peptidyl-prolyl cis-trans isomerase C
MNGPLPAIAVNGVPLSPEALRQEAQNHPAASPEAAVEAAARALVVRELLLQEARRQGLKADPQADERGRLETDEDALIRALLDRELAVPTADDESCRRYYEKNRGRFRAEDLFEARHILLPAAPEDVEGRARAEAQAAALILQLTSAPQRFAELAAAHSACPSREQGGHLGQLTRGQTVPEFETFLCNLEAGQLCPVPVRTRFGLHVLRLERKLVGAPLPFEAVRERIAAYLEAASWNRAVSQYLAILAAEAKITGISLQDAAAA